MAGACCQVYFAKYAGSSGSRTLNINSTGAKYWGYKSASHSNETARNWLTNNTDIGYINAASLFVVYDGSYYMSYYGGDRQFYNDYNDA